MREAPQLTCAEVHAGLVPSPPQGACQWCHLIFCLIGAAECLVPGQQLPRRAFAALCPAGRPPAPRRPALLSPGPCARGLTLAREVPLAVWLHFPCSGPHRAAAAQPGLCPVPSRPCGGKVAPSRSACQLLGSRFAQVDGGWGHRTCSRSWPREPEGPPWVTRLAPGPASGPRCWIGAPCRPHLNVLRGSGCLSALPSLSWWQSLSSGPSFLIPGLAWLRVPGAPGVLHAARRAPANSAR